MANNNPQNEAATAGGAEAAAEPGNPAANTSAHRKSQIESGRVASIANALAPPLKKQKSNGHVNINSPSPASSPRTSRNASPTRKDSRPQPLSNPPSTQPSAAAIQRALSAANVPPLQSGAATDGGSKILTAPKGATASGNNTPHWPTSPRLKSPPPSANNSRRGSSTGQKKAENGAAPTINVQNTASQTSTPPPVKQGMEETLKSPQAQTTAKGLASRGASGKSTLETVQENSADDLKEPSPAAVKAAADLKPLTKVSDDEKQASKGENGAVEGEKTNTTTAPVESGSESAGTKSPKKKDQNNQTQRSRSSRNYLPLVSTKSRLGEGKQNMTVETETVPSIPQSALNVGDRSGTGRSENSASVKQKPSSETIRPKKERKKTSQKPRSINQGTGMFSLPQSPLLTSQEYFTPSPAGGSHSSSSRSSSTVREACSSGTASPLLKRQFSYSERVRRAFSLPRSPFSYRSLSNRTVHKASSKADIFEQRVANAVDEANSSESDETFVYESNPPEPRRARHHSRTPSVTSSHSVADQQRSSIRNFGDVLDDRRVAGKRSMKFSSNAGLGADVDSPDSKDGSVRAHQPRHFGRFGRGGSQQSMFDPDSPFTQASKLRSSQLNARSSRPNSPRNNQNANSQSTRSSSTLFGRKQENSYDFDAEVGDDERTPLVGTVRTPRGQRLASHRRSLNRSPSIDEYFGVRRRSRCGRLSGCVLAFIVLAVVLLSTVTFLVMSNRPLYDVKISAIENVLASEQELMLDLLVKAVNPNALGITVSEMDVNVFARSKHVGSSFEMNDQGVAPWRQRGRKVRPEPWPAISPTKGGVDEGTDPPDDDEEEDSTTMLLGRISHFDTPLTFEGSPLKRDAHLSVGELRLAKPGNKTETGGSARWKKVLQYPFTLITRGSLKYNLPISNRLMTVAVDAAVVVHPDEEADRLGHAKLSPVTEGEKWVWVEWPDEDEDVEWPGVEDEELDKR